MGNVEEEWSPTPIGQIENPMGFCLEAVRADDNSIVVVAKICSKTNPPPASQHLIYEQQTGHFKTSMDSQDLCLTVVLPEAEDRDGKKRASLEECSNSELMQMWKVYQ